MAPLYLLLTLTFLFVAIETKEELNLDDVTTVVGEKFDYQIGNEEFLATYKIYRIVQRGQRKLPGWLTFDKNSSMLIGYPKTEDVGLYTLRMRAQCIDPAITYCQDKLSRTFHVTVIEPLKSAESRGRHTFTKHEKNGKWIYTNMHNGNTRLYVEYDISRHGTVVENTSGMLVSGSEHVLSTGALYSAMQYNVANYFLNKNLHDKLSSKSYLAMQYRTATNYMSHSDLHEQFSNNVYPSVHYTTFPYSDSIHNSDSYSESSSELYSSMQYSSSIDSIHNSDLHEKFHSHAEETLQYKQIFIPEKDFHSHYISEKSPRDLYSSTHYGAKPSKVYGTDSFEKVSTDSNTTLKFKAKTISDKKSKDHDNPVQDLCQRDETAFYTSLILHVINNLTNPEEEFIIRKWSKFISKDPDVMFISRTESDVMGIGYSGKYILTGGPGNVIESLSNSVELSWHIACGFFEQVHDFTRILQHNIEVGRVSEEIGFGVIAWFVYTDRPLPKRVRRQAHSGRRRTATPTFSPPVPTTLSEMSTAVLESSVSYSFISLMSSDITSSSVIFSLSSALLPTSVSSFTSLVTSKMSFSLLNISSTVPVTSSGTYGPGFSSLFTKSVISSFTTFAMSSTYSGISIAFSSFETSLASFTTALLLPSFSNSSYLSVESTLFEQPSVSYLLSSESRNPTLVILSSPSLSSSSFTSVLSSSTAFSSIGSIYTSSFQDISTSYLSSFFPDFSSSETEYISPSDTSLIKTLVTSSMQKSISKLESSLNTSFQLEEITSTSMPLISTFSPSLSGQSSSSSLYETISSASSSLLSSYSDIVSSIYSVNKSTPFLHSTEIFEISMSRSSFITLLSVSPFTSRFDTAVLSSYDLSSEFTSFGFSLSSSLISQSVSSKTSSTAYLSTLSVVSDTGIFRVSSSSLIISKVTSEFNSSNTVLSTLMSSSEDISVSATSVFPSTKSITDVTIYPSSVRTLPIFPTTLVSPYLTSSLPLSSSSIELFSPTFSTTFSSEKTETYKSSMLISSSVVSTVSFSSIEPSMGVTSETISSLSSIKISSSVPSSATVTEESSVFELTPSLPEFSTSDMFGSAYSTLVSESSALTTVPSSEDSSMISTLVPSTIISPTRVSVTYSLTSMGSTEVVSTAAPDESPSLEKSIDHLRVVVGRYFEFQIPERTFSDKEDGNTRNLSLRISLTYSKPFPKDAWLTFNETSQTFYGIPLKKDSEGERVLSEFTLIAEDSQGQVAKDAISLTYEYEKDVNHRISVTLNGSYEKFTNDRIHLIQVAQYIADFYDDKNLKFLTFSSLEKGSVVIVWSNNSLLGSVCIKKEIQELYDRLSDENGTISDQFTALFTDFTPINTSLEFLEACLLPVTSFAPPTKSPVSETDNKMWIEIVLPALIAILVIVIIALLLLICCRHRRPSKEIKDSDKPAFLEDRRPIIFPEELEMVDPSLKPKTPLVLPSDYLTETPPAVPPHGQPAPPYRTPMLDEGRFPGEDEDPPHPSTYTGHSQQTEPPPYRLPPPYYNPHRMA